MGISRALVNKLKRRRKSMNPNRGIRRQDKIDRKDEVLADSPGAYKYLRGIQRRLDANFGQQQVASPEKTPKEFYVSVDVADNAGAAELTFATDLMAEIGVQPGDIVKFVEGTLAGEQLAIATLDSADVASTEAAATTPTAETVMVKIQLSGTKSSYK